MSKNVFSCLAKLWKGFCPGGNDMYEYTQQKYTGFWGLNYTFEFYCLGFIFQVLSTCPPCSNLSWNLFRCILRPSVPVSFGISSLMHVASPGHKLPMSDWLVQIYVGALGSLLLKAIYILCSTMFLSLIETLFCQFVCSNSRNFFWKHGPKIS